MMKFGKLAGAVLAAALMTPMLASAGEVPADKVKAIKDMLATIKCEVDAGNIEHGSKGYELDDVFCADGQYDMKLSDDLKITSKKKE